MVPGRLRMVRAIGLVICVLAQASLAGAQGGGEAGRKAPPHEGVELSPLVGYRFGNDFFEIVAGQPIDTDGSATFGVMVGVPLGGGLQVEAQYSHQEATVTVPADLFFRPEVRTKVTIDHWLAGALQEYSKGRARPYAIGGVGLTRYAGADDSEMRFTASAGGGVKLFPKSRVGVRFNSQIYATFVYADATVVSYSPGLSLLGLHADIVWQIDFTAALVFKVS